MPASDRLQPLLIAESASEVPACLNLQFLICELEAVQGPPTSCLGLCEFSEGQGWGMEWGPWPLAAETASRKNDRVV